MQKTPPTVRLVNRLVSHPDTVARSVMICSMVMAVMQMQSALAQSSVLKAVADADSAEMLSLVTVKAPGQGCCESATIQPGLVKAKTLERHAATDLEDMLATQAEVQVGGGHAGAQKIYVRGFEDTMLSVTVDGAAQVGQLFHHTGRIQIEPELMSQVAVSPGAGDATAGPGALGGAVRFTTKDPEELLAPNQQVGALLKTGYFSNAKGRKSHLSVYGRFGESWSALAALTQQDLRDYRNGAGDIVPTTGSRQELGFFKVLGKVAPDHQLRLSYEHNRERGKRSQRPQWVASSFNRAYPLQRDRSTWRLGYHWQPHEVNADVQLTLYRTQADMEQNVIGRWGRYLGNIQSTGLDLRNIQHFGAHSLTYGVDYRKDGVRAGYAANPSEQGEDGQVAGLYAQAQLAATETVAVQVGARYDLYRWSNSLGANKRAAGISPNLSMRYQISPALTFLAGHARALRAQQVRDAFKLEDVGKIVPNTKPERASTSEAGFEYREGDWRIQTKAYRSVIRDAITDPLGKPVRFENVGTLQSAGLVLHTAYDWRNWQLAASLHHNKTTLNGQRLNGYEHSGLGTSQGSALTGSVDYKVSEEWDVGWLGRFVKSIKTLKTQVGTVRKPGYSVHDIYAQWSPRNLRGLSVSLAVKNLLNKSYLDHGSNEDFQHLRGYQGIVGAREPGRELRLGLELRF